jgi:hypothetical protein
MSAVQSCPRHGPVHDPGAGTCSALMPRMIAGELEIVRCALPLELRAAPPELDLRNADSAVPRRHVHLHAITDRLRRRTRALVS